MRREDKKLRLKMKMFTFVGFKRMNMAQGVALEVTNLSSFDVVIREVYVPRPGQNIEFDQRFTCLPYRIEPRAIETFGILISTLEYYKLPERIRAIVVTSTGEERSAGMFQWRPENGPAGDLRKPPVAPKDAPSSANPTEN